MIVLASGSPTRAAILRAAGVEVVIDPARVDEAEVKAAVRTGGATAAEAAEALAEIKARQVARRHAGALVIGADQILDCGGVWFDKPPDRDHARAQLMALRNKTHHLFSAAVVVRDGERIWHAVDQARLVMRPFSDTFLDDYLRRTGDAAMSSVGAYQLEGLGAQMFSRVEGNHFTILGLPLLPLLALLRDRGELVP